MAMTFSSLQNEVNTNLQFHPKYTAMTPLGVNKGIEEVTKFTRQLDQRWSINSIQNPDGSYVQEYDMTPIFPLEVNAVTFDSKPLTELTREEWIACQRRSGLAIAGGNLVIGDPTSYFIHTAYVNQTQPPTQPASPPTTLLCVYPQPGRVAVIEAWINPIPTDLVNATDVPVTVPSSCRDSIVCFATYYCLRSWAEEQVRADWWYKQYLAQRRDDKEQMRVNKVVKIQRVQGR